MESCRKCNKNFVVTSWTRNRDWRRYCPACIIAGLEELMTLLKPEARAAWNRPE
jgi:hypothetical protein